MMKEAGGSRSIIHKLLDSPQSCMAVSAIFSPTPIDRRIIDILAEAQ